MWNRCWAVETGWGASSKVSKKYKTHVSEVVSEVGRGRGSDRRSGEQKPRSVYLIAPHGGCPGCHTHQTSHFGHQSGWTNVCVFRWLVPLHVCQIESGCVWGGLESAILSAAPSRREAEFLEVGDSVEVHERSRDHQDVEQLVRVELGTRQRDLLNVCEGQTGQKEEEGLPLTQMSHFPGKNLSGMRAA